MFTHGALSTPYTNARSVFLHVYFDIQIGTRDPECYVMESAEDYRGHLSVAADGSTCLNWAKTTSYLFYINPMDYPDAGLGDHNYCRNPGGIFSSTRCYVVEDDEYLKCNIGSPKSECTEGMLSTYDRSISRRITFTIFSNAVILNPSF